MGCTGECPSNCGANYVCVGNQPACPANGKNGSGWTETLVAGTTLIKASHLAELESAINAERTHATRRGAGTSTACGSNTPGSYSFSGSRSVGDVINATHFTNVAKAINGTPFNVNGNTESPGSIVSDPYVNSGDVITKAQIDALRSAINDVEGYCICDSYTTLVCGCHNQCDTDGDPY
jgi:hypothetical protein